MPASLDPGSESASRAVPVRPRRSWGIALAIGIWSVVVTIGLGVLVSYAHTPEAPAQPPQTWPPHVSLATSDDRATLILFAHPRCPCTRSSIAELGRIVTRRRGHVRAHVLLLRPDEFDAGWEKTDLWEQAAMLPDVEVHADPGGSTTRAFGAATSGQVLLYDRGGRLVFQGGITASRGHEGDNVGTTAVLSILGEEETGPDQSDVYGCPLVARKDHEGER